MTKTTRTNQYPRMEFKTKKALRSFKTIFDMFTSGKLSENIDNNNLSRSESVSFYMRMRKNPDKYLHNMVLSAKQSNFVNTSLHIDTCKEHHCNKYYTKCYDCSYNTHKYGCDCVCKGCYDTTGNCSICMTRNKTNTIKLDCSHIFHKECIDKWITHFRKTTCPYCRTPVNQELFPQPIVQAQPIVQRVHRLNYTRDLMNRTMEHINGSLFTHILIFLNSTHIDL